MGGGRNPLKRGDRFIGVVGLQLSLDAINSVMQQREGMGRTGETYRARTSVCAPTPFWTFWTFWTSRATRSTPPSPAPSTRTAPYAGASEEMAATAEELSSQADQLLQAISLFRLEDTAGRPPARATSRKGVQIVHVGGALAQQPMPPPRGLAWP